MSTIIKHRRVNIVTLQQGDRITDHCRAGDIVIVQDDEGWWTQFVGDDGETEGYDAPFESYDKALWTAKAAAEFSSE
jgi:hypothetical protein